MDLSAGPAMTGGSFAGRVAVVTGASAGVGRAVATALAAEGAAVGLVARTAEPLRALAAELARDGGAGRRALALPADVADEAAIGAAVERAAGELGGLDLLVACAGMNRRGAVDGYPLADWHAVLATNLTGDFLTARAALPHLKARGGGHIVAVSSGAGLSWPGCLSAVPPGRRRLDGLVGQRKSVAMRTARYVGWSDFSARTGLEWAPLNSAKSPASQVCEDCTSHAARSSFSKAVTSLPTTKRSNSTALDNLAVP